MRRISYFGLAAALAFGLPLSAVAGKGGNGNGAPSGGHYSLNIIGVPKDKTADMTGSRGHVIFVKLEGKSKIWLCESGEDTGCADYGF